MNAANSDELIGRGQIKRGVAFSKSIFSALYTICSKVVENDQKTITCS